ncbi:hypothetical protein EFM10_05050 [Lactobacillus helveticus]|uniref:hypothetical protein n=1 Tax=Lactobacillus helveticus TaxID=1587 RepID=UPI0021823988|nr:hypothetical protein [Lactobacillus helveticus]MCT0192534.1 hypothetical protein [Lactobacillus helveticus]
MLRYDENGNLRDYEEDQQKVVCEKCHKTYLQETVEQVAGFREVDDDVCPYCGHVNRLSGEVEFFSHKL